MKKIKLTGKLNLNKITITVLNNQENIIGGAKYAKSDRRPCLDTYADRTCETLTLCYTHPCCLSVGCPTRDVHCNIFISDKEK